MKFDLSSLSANEYNHGLDALDNVSRYLQTQGFATACAWVRGDDSQGSLLLAYADAGNLVAEVRQAYIEAV